MCSCKEAEFFTSVYGFDYVECKECENLYMQNPIQDISKLYINDGTQSTFQSYYNDEVFNQRLENIAKPKAKFANEVVMSFANKKELWLDIGCGAGDFLFAAKDLGYEILGYESDLLAINFANNKLAKKVVKEGFLDIFNTDKDLLKIIQKTQIISFLNVVEHLEYPRQTIEFFAKNMKKDSFLIIEVPRHPSLASFANLMANDRIYRHLIAPVHLNIFSEKALKKVYEKHFRLAGKWCYGQGFMDIIHAFEKFNENHKLYNCASNISNQIQKIIDKNNLADFMFLILQKI